MNIKLHLNKWGNWKNEETTQVTHFGGYSVYQRGNNVRIKYTGKHGREDNRGSQFEKKCNCGIHKYEKKELKPYYQFSKDYKNKQKIKDQIEKLEAEANKIAKEMIDILIKKHSDYGPNNIAKAPGGPINGLSVRLHDKVERLGHLTKNNIDPKNESLRDTFIDIANYAIIGLLVLDNKWN